MKIAIIAPSSVPFCIGGAENLWWGLLEHINQYTSHQAELIKLPTKEQNFWEIIYSYQSFSNLDLSHFDLVISGKYPAWMVKHPHHICYMLHKLRGLYDTYHFTGLPESFVAKHPDIRWLKAFMKRHQYCRDALPEFFERLSRLRNVENIPQDVFRFPGPLIREVVHFLDNIGLAPDSIERYYAISKTVANRNGYFPPSVFVGVIHPPSNLNGFNNRGADYLFTASRLDGPKRVDLLIQAMRHVRTQIELRIAGNGPAMEKLESIARDDPRIRFLGFVNNRELVNLYAGALVVPFVPYDEDYGLITVETMKSGKPVITTFDAGGPNEFVVDGRTGFSVSPDPAAIAERIEYCCKHREEMQRMGLAAKETVAHINWENTVAQLLKGKLRQSKKNAMGRRRKIVVAITFPVFPPRGGGQTRIYHLYRHLANHFDIDLITFTHSSDSPLDEIISPGLREIRVPKSLIHEKREAKLSGRVNWMPITDTAMPKLYHLTPAYLDALKRSASSADIVIASHPYLFPAIHAVCDKPLWYEAHNVEIELKQNILPDNSTTHELLRLTEEVECACCQLSELIMVCAKADGEKLCARFGVDSNKIVEVPNGVDLNSVTYVTMEERLAAKKRLGLSDTFTVLFMGSWHGPNLQAMNEIFKLAKKLPNIYFLIVGSVCYAFSDKLRPRNVGFMGTVEDEEKDIILSVADLAINPMLTGSGTNLKMLDYCASGVPVLSTPHGIRGLLLQNQKHVFVADVKDFESMINNIIIDYNRKIDKLKLMTAKAQEIVENSYSWKKIAENLNNAIQHKLMCPSLIVS